MDVKSSAGRASPKSRPIAAHGSHSKIWRALVDVQLLIAAVAKPCNCDHVSRCELQLCSVSAAWASPGASSHQLYLVAFSPSPLFLTMWKWVAPVQCWGSASARQLAPDFFGISTSWLVKTASTKGQDFNGFCWFSSPAAWLGTTGRRSWMKTAKTGHTRMSPAV